MAEKLLIDIEGSVRKLCAERGIPVDAVRFFGSRAAGEADAGSDIDFVLVSPAFEGKDIFQRAGMTRGMHRALVKRFQVPFDILFCSVSDWQNSTSPLLEEARKAG